MKKSKFTKLALLGLATGCLISAQSIQAAEIVDVNHEDASTLIAHGSCGADSCNGRPSPQGNYYSQRPRNDSYYNTMGDDTNTQPQGTQGANSQGPQGTNSGYQSGSQTPQQGSSIQNTPNGQGGSNGNSGMYRGGNPNPNQNQNQNQGGSNSGGYSGGYLAFDDNAQGELLADCKCGKNKKEDNSSLTAFNDVSDVIESNEDLAFKGSLEEGVESDEDLIASEGGSEEGSSLAHHENPEAHSEDAILLA